MTEPLFRIPVGEGVEAVVDWLTTAFDPLFDLIKNVLLGGYDALDALLTSPPAWGIIAVLAMAAWGVAGWRLGVGTALGLGLVYGMDQFDNAMHTLALVLLATTVALLLAVPVGIWCARNDRVSAAVRPILDFMQTMPAFVYLIPTVVIFLTGPVPGLVATVIFALPPGVRMTELGIRQVDAEVVEAGEAFGATPGRILRQIQVPLAMPTIMAGVNQVIMLSLSMAVISGMVGAQGLGQEVVLALGRVDVGLGFEAGLAVVILAIVLDRITSALGSRSAVARVSAAAHA